VELERLTWKQTRSRLRADRARLLARLEASGAGRPTLLRLHPSFVCVRLYRISNHFFRGGHRHLARLAWHLNVLLTGADISPPSDLGEGLDVVSPVGIAIMGKAGRNLTVGPMAGMGGEVGRREDVGAGPGLPVLGDDVVLEHHAGVLGPIRIGDRARIGAGALALKDVAADTLLRGPEPRFRGRTEPT
jgi:serine O-acetyltransferase